MRKITELSTSEIASRQRHPSVNRDTISSVTVAASTPETDDTIANASVITTLSERKVPCRKCLGNAHKAMDTAMRMPLGYYRTRWETWACEMFLVSYTHPAYRCNNTIRIG